MHQDRDYARVDACSSGVRLIPGSAPDPAPRASRARPWRLLRLVASAVLFAVSPVITRMTLAFRLGALRPLLLLLESPWEYDLQKAHRELWMVRGWGIKYDQIK